MLVGMVGFIGLVVIGIFIQEKFLDILENFLDK